MQYSAILLLLSATAVIGATVPATRGAVGQCDPAAVQCCDQVKDSHSPDVQDLLANLGVELQDITGQVGLNCNPITGIGLGGGGTCAEQPVCCSDNGFNGVVSLGCTPITAGL